MCHLWPLGLRYMDLLILKNYVENGMNFHERRHDISWYENFMSVNINNLYLLVLKGYPRKTHYLVLGSAQWLDKVDAKHKQTSNEHYKGLTENSICRDFCCLKQDLEVWFIRWAAVKTQPAQNIDGKLAWNNKDLLTLNMFWCLRSKTPFIVVFPHNTFDG